MKIYRRPAYLSMRSAPLYNPIMQELIQGFANQLKEAMGIGEKAILFKPKAPIANVIVNGMGGSGIGGTIVSELVSTKSKVPVYANKSYFLPEYAGENTLVIVDSYSGNTEESVQALESALEAGAKVVCITSGGQIHDIARQKKIDHITIPQGFPPRAALGYSIVQIFYILYKFDIIDEYFLNDFDQAIRLLENEEENIKSEAKRIASVLFGKTPVIYAPIRSEGVAVRFRQELNENAKMLAWHNMIPEMNHNEILGWSEKRDDLAVIFFRNDTDYSRIQKRVELTREVVLKYASRVVEIDSKGASMIERAIYQVHMGDWISFFLAEMRKVDPNEIQTIEYLKSALAKSE